MFPIKRLLIVIQALTGLILPDVSQAWSHQGHRIMTELALTRVSTDWGLDKPVRVQTITALANKLAAPAEKTSRRFADDKTARRWLGKHLQLNPDIDFTRFEADERPGTLIRPRDILIRHSTDPDDGRDQNLNLHSYQKIFGGTTGPSSQAFRHMEKPRLSLWNWRSTLGLPFKQAGEASLRAQLYFDLARFARDAGEDYWSWRFLACALHYIEDLAQPHHTTEISSRGRLFGRGLRIYFGRKSNLGFSAIVSRLVTNSHDWFETYSATILTDNLAAWRNGDHLRPQLRRLFDTLERANIGNTRRSIAQRATRLRDRSNATAPKLLKSIFHIGDNRISGLYRYDQESWPAPDPRAFVNPVRDKTFWRHEKRFYRHLWSCLRRGGFEVRTTVAAFLRPAKTAPHILFAPPTPRAAALHSNEIPSPRRLPRR